MILFFVNCIIFLCQPHLFYSRESYFMTDCVRSSAPWVPYLFCLLIVFLFFLVSSVSFSYCHSSSLSFSFSFSPLSEPAWITDRIFLSLFYSYFKPSSFIAQPPPRQICAGADGDIDVSSLRRGDERNLLQHLRVGIYCTPVGDPCMEHPQGWRQSSR